MSVKTLDEIKVIIEKGRPQWVHEAIKEHKRLDVHINGKHTAAYLKQIDSIENATQLKLRKDYLTTNRHAFVELTRPIDKVFSAKGGGTIITHTNDDKVRDSLSNVRHGKTLKNWVKDIQSNKYYTDPAGLVFFEWTATKTYPTLKSIVSIENYESDGRTLEWVLFVPEEREGQDGKFYRFVDNEDDIMIHKKGEVYTIVEDETYDNIFGRVPAIINSNIINSDLTYNESPFEPVISLADHYLRTGTIKNINEFLHGFPIFWRYLASCKPCGGTGLKNGVTCPACGGLGVNVNKDVTDIINIEIPEKETDVKIAPEVAGYVSPDVTSWQEMRTEQDWLFSMMQLTIWGSKMSPDASNETATAAFLNVQPVNDQLNNFSDAFEDMEQKMADFITSYYVDKEQVISVNYGRRFLVEPPEVIWDKYEKAKQNGSPKVSLDYLLTQFYQSEFANDLENLTIAQKGIKLEPFVHKTDEEIDALPIDQQDKLRKYYFNEWFKTVPQEDVLTKDIKKLNDEFNVFINGKKLNNELKTQ